MMISLCFLILPFTYFYAEETLESGEEDMDLFDNDFSEEDDDDELQSNSTKSQSSKKTRRHSGEGQFAKIWDKIYKASR